MRIQSGLAKPTEDPGRAVRKDLLHGLAKAPCSFKVDTCFLKGLPHYDLAVYVYTVKLHGTFGYISRHAYQYHFAVCLTTLTSWL